MSKATATATTSSGGIGFSSLLTLIFITLKLTHVIAWSWFWVLFPTILTTALGLLFVGVILLILAVSAVLAFLAA